MSGPRPTGFSLVELLVALTVFAMGVLAVGSTAMHAAQTLRRAEARHDATRLAASLLDSLARAAPPQDGGVHVDGLHAEWHVQPEANGTFLVRLEVRAAGVAEPPLRFGMRTAAETPLPASP